MPQSGYKHTLGWNLGFSSYWFATSFKWFILLLVFIPDKVSQIVPDGEKNTWWGLILGTGAIWALFGPSLFGRMSETGSRKWRHRAPWIELGSGLTCIALVGVLQAPNLLLLAAAYFLLQVSDDLGTGPYAGMVADTVPSEHRGFASSVLGGFKLSGQLLSAISAMILGEWMLIFIGIGTVNVLCAAWTIYTIRDVPSRPEPVARQPWIREYFAPFKNRDFLFVWLNRLIVAFAFSCISAYSLNYLKDMHESYMLFGLDLGDAGKSAQVLALTVSFSGILGAILSSRLSDRIGRKPLLIWSAVGAASSLAPIILVKDYSTLWIFVFFYGLANGIYISADWAMASDVLPSSEKSATEMGAWQSSETAVQIPAGLVMGAFIDAFNRVTFGLGYKVMLGTAALLFLASTIIVPRIRSVR
ncbi:MFS transporter [Kamptonema cortianum]|nr:MFS transporter [Geitlerinema splendidum]MDK3160449.1 MFS transporter [Kamptonema cortianum]